MAKYFGDLAPEDSATSGEILVNADQIADAQIWTIGCWIRYWSDWVWRKKAKRL